MKFKPSKNQQIVLDSKDKNILVSASAGTGKTTVMIEKISGLLTSGQATLKELLVVTFTEMAAYEMKKRLVKNLSQSDDAKILSQLGQIDTCNISTLHSFCSALIRKYFVEAEIDPAYKILTDTEWTIAFDKVLDETFEQLYREQDADFLFLVDVFGKKRKDDSLKKIVKSVYAFKTAKHDFDGWLKKHSQNYHINQNENFFTQQYNQMLCDELVAIKTRCENLAVVAKEMEQTKLLDFFAKYASEITVATHKTLEHNMQQVVEINLPRFPAKQAEAQAENPIQFEFFQQCKKAKDEMSEAISKHRTFLKQFCYDQLVSNMKNSFEVCTKLFVLVQKFCDEFALYKEQNGCLDFNDLEHLALKVLDVPKVRQEVKQNFKFVFVDEYQDINEIQEEIISKIKGENNLFLVGDVKQSIYAFRQCAPDIFVQKLNDYSQDQNHLVAYLNDNYRSHNHVLDFVNEVFSKIMTADFGGIDYKTTSMLGYPENGSGTKTNLSAVTIDYILQNEKIENEEEVYNEVGSVYSVKYKNYVDIEPQKAEAQIIAKRIREVVGLKIKVDDKEKVITYNDVVLLTRGMNPQTKKIISELESLGLPITYTGKQNLFDSTEIKQLVNLFKVADNPYDDVALFGCLTGAFCGVTEDEIAEIFVCTKASQKGGEKTTKTLVERVTDYCHTHDSTLSCRLQAFLQFLNKVTFLSKNLTVTQLVSKLFAQTDYVLKVLGLPDGEMRLKKVNDFLLSLESKSYNKNIAEFLRFTNAVSDEQVEVESTSQTNAVHVMTIHKSKGLEFPVVFVINCGQKLNLKMPSVLCDKQYGFSSNAFDVNLRIKKDTLSNWFVRQQIKKSMLQEEMRILYVAMTRAKCHLYLTGCIKQNSDYGEKEGEECQSYFDWILGALSQGYSCECQINHSFEWQKDQSETKNERKPLCLPQCDQNRVQQVKTQLLQKYPYQFATSLELKAVSSKLHDYQKPQGDEDVCLPKIVAPEVDSEGLQQNEIGTGYHAVFEHLDFCNKTIEHIAEVVSMLVQKNVITQQVADAIDKNVVLKAMNSPLFAMLEGKKIYRELPFMLKTSYQNLFGGEVDENMFLQGVIDMLAVGKDEAIVVDYKYTKRPQYIKQNYQKQLDSYAQAVKQILKIDNVKKYVLSLADGQIVEL